MPDRRTDRHMDVQPETIIPHHYLVAVYKKNDKQTDRRKDEGPEAK